MSVATIVALVTAAISGGVVQALITWVKDRRRDASEVQRTDVETKLAYLNTVIEHLDKQAERERADKERALSELAAAHDENRTLREKVHNLQDELYEVRRSARETEHRCNELAAKLHELIEEENRNEAA
jgi:chromosome segregation ATPase